MLAPERGQILQVRKFSTERRGRLMKIKNWARCAYLLVSFLVLTGCSTHADPEAEAPPPAHVEHEDDLNVVKAQYPEQFPLVAAGMHTAASQLVVTGTVNPDVSRTVPVISLASGR